MGGGEGAGGGPAAQSGYPTTPPGYTGGSASDFVSGGFSYPQQNSFLSNLGLGFSQGTQQFGKSLAAGSQGQPGGIGTPQVAQSDIPVGSTPFGLIQPGGQGGDFSQILDLLQRLGLLGGR